jgi:hypothetical protein
MVYGISTHTVLLQFSYGVHPIQLTRIDRGAEHRKRGVLIEPQRTEVTPQLQLLECSNRLGPNELQVREVVAWVRGCALPQHVNHGVGGSVAYGVHVGLQVPLVQGWEDLAELLTWDHQYSMMVTSSMVGSMKKSRLRLQNSINEELNTLACELLGLYESLLYKSPVLADHLIQVV